MSKKMMYENLKDMLCHELDEITRKGAIDRSMLDDIYKLTSAITMVESLSKKRPNGGDEEEYPNDYSNEGGSNAYRRSMRGSYDDMSNRMGNSRYYSDSYGNSNRVGPYSRGDSYEGSYDDYSEARGRDVNTGRYVSRHTAEEKIANKLEDMISSTQDPHIRETLTQAMNRLK